MKAGYTMDRFNFQYFVMMNSEKQKKVSNETTRREITASICSHYGVTVLDVMSKSRKKELVMARQLAIYFIRKHTSYSLKQVGMYFGGRDHSTVCHAIGCISGLPVHDEQFKDREYFAKKFSIYKTQTTKQ
jgi:chromosomal replication initiator protein